MPRGERPLDGPDQDLISFAQQLRQLREKAGGPTYRELARRAHYSAATLSDAAGGRKLPTLEATLAYVRACDGDAELWREKWQALAQRPAAPVDDGGARAPYVGLAAFQEEDAYRFFGRERLLGDLLRRLARQRLVVVFGASGAGKSSLLRAGLVAALRAEGRCRPVLITPGRDPVGRLAAVPDPGPDEEVVLVVDQFEEVFTLCADPAERTRFVAALVRAGGRCRVVLGVRADFYPHCVAMPELVPALRDGQVPVGPMTLDELRRAVTAPASAAGYVLEGGLLATVLTHAYGRSGVLPLVSHALLETWRRRHGMTLTVAAFEAVGGVDGALANTAEAVYTELTPARQAVLRGLMLRLTALGEGTEDTKRRVPHDELDRADPAAVAVLDRMIAARLVTADATGVEIAHEALIRCWPRLRDWLAEDRDGRRVHRQLTEATEAWHAVRRDAGSLYRGVRLARAAEWAAAHGEVLTPREREFLDAGLHAARRGRRRSRRLVALLTALLLVTGVAGAYAETGWETAVRQRDIATAERVAHQAAQLRAAEPALAAQLGLVAYRLAPTPVTRSALLSTFGTPYAVRLTGHAANVDRVAVAPGGRLLASASQDHTVRLWDIGNPYRPGLLAALNAHGAAVTAIAFTPDGGTLATAGADGTVRLWDVADPRRPRQRALLRGGTDEVHALAVSPDGTLLATSGRDRAIRLWRLGPPPGPAAGSQVPGSQVPGAQAQDRSAQDRSARGGSARGGPVQGVPAAAGTLTGHADIVLSAVFAPDGRTLATTSRDGTARLWDIAGRGRPAVLTGHRGPVESIAYDPAGRTVATAGADRTVRLWDVTRPRSPRRSAVLTGHTDTVRSVAFAPDGTQLASAAADRTARLWNVADRGRPYPVGSLPGHQDAVVSAAFTPDGRALATASDDDTVRLWTLPGPVITGHRDSVYGVAFAPDGRTLATTGYDATTRLSGVTDPHHPEPGPSLGGHRDAVNAAAFTADGRLLATAGADHTVRLWGPMAGNPRQLSTLAEHTDAVNALALAPGGRILATADHAVRLWDVGDPARPIALNRLDGHAGRVDAVAFSADGRTLASAGTDRTVRLWDVSDPAQPVARGTLTGHGDAVKSVAFRPDGRSLATSGVDRTIRLWPLAGAGAAGTPAVLAGHSDTVYAVAFSPDGRTLASAGADRTARLWDVAEAARPGLLAELAGHADRVDAVAFSPGGHTLATGGIDRTARLWETEPRRAAGLVCAYAHPPITRSEWERYLPAIGYDPPCS